MIEYTSNFLQNISDSGLVITQHQPTVSPGLRYCLDNGRMQIVPGVATPISMTNGSVDMGVFLYLSFEPDYLSFYKAKGR